MTETTNQSILKPTVSQLISLLDKPALLKWANKLGLDGTSLQQYRIEQANEGTKTHKLIENDLKHGIKYENKNYQEFIKRYKVIEVEPVIDCDHYRGRADILLEHNGVRFLFDWKSADRIYLEQKLQLVAYKRVLNADKLGIVHTRTFVETILNITPEQEKLYHRIIGGLYNVWMAKQQLGE